MLEPGDIFATRGKGIVGWLSKKMTAPETDRFHFGLVWQKVDDDYLILESISSKGVAIGRLSFYSGEDVKFYRANCPQVFRAAAPVELTKWGRSHYDWMLIPKLITQGIGLITKHLVTEGKFKIRAEELTWCQNNSFLCTEAVDLAYDAVGVNIIPLGICPIPSAFRQAEIDSNIIPLLDVERAAFTGKVAKV